MTVSPLGAVVVDGVGTTLAVSPPTGTPGVLTLPETSLDTGALGYTVTTTVWPLGAVEVEGEGTTLVDSPLTGTTGVLSLPETSLDAGALGVTVTTTVWPFGAVVVEGVGTTLAVSPETEGPVTTGVELLSVTVWVTGQTVVVSGTTWVTTAVEPSVETVDRLVVKIVLVVYEVGSGVTGVLASPSTPDEAVGVAGVDSALTGIRVVISVVDAGTKVV